jgi:hypothetical protein
MKSSKILIVLGVFLAIAPALVLGNTFEPIFDLLTSLWSIIPLYEQNPYPIDFVIAVLIFGGMASYLLSERVGKLAAWGTGIALAFGFVGYEYANKTSFILKAGPIALNHRCHRDSDHLLPYP